VGVRSKFVSSSLGIMSGSEFRVEIEPYLEVIKSGAKFIEKPEDREAFLESMSTMFGEGYVAPECFFACVISEDGYMPGRYESLPKILPRYFDYGHPVITPAYNAIINIYTSKYQNHGQC